MSYAPELSTRRLQRVDPEEFTIERHRRGRGFVYLSYEDEIDDEETLERIAALVIPPAWEDVLISDDPDAHIQAVGIDAAGRRQYLYHALWRVQRDEAKFEEMLDFARDLPQLRRRVSADLKRKDLSRNQVLACATRLLDLGFFRVGREEHSQANNTFGLATLLRDHAHLEGREKIAFDYIAKGGKQRTITITDSSVHRTLRQIQQEDPDGPRLLSYLANDWFVDISSADVNDYIKEASGGSYSAKDFRTWNATVLAATRIATRLPLPESESGMKRAINGAVKEVAEALGNTPAVCRSSYIDPRVFERYRDSVTIAPALEQLQEVRWPLKSADRDLLEASVIELLQSAGRNGKRHQKNSSLNGHAVESDLMASLRATLQAR